MVRKRERLVVPRNGLSLENPDAAWLILDPKLFFAAADGKRMIFVDNGLGFVIGACCLTLTLSLSPLKNTAGHTRQSHLILGRRAQPVRRVFLRVRINVPFGALIRHIVVVIVVGIIIRVVDIDHAARFQQAGGSGMLIHLGMERWGKGKIMGGGATEEAREKRGRGEDEKNR